VQGAPALDLSDECCLVITAADLTLPDSSRSLGEILVDAGVETINDAGETIVENITICPLIQQKTLHQDLEVAFTAQLNQEAIVKLFLQA
jgi:hypothetical protein